MAAANLRLSRLTRQYADRLVLNGFSLAVEPGHITAILGEAGSGKSALIRILAGFERQSSGTVELDGTDIGRLAAHRRGFGVVQRPDQLFPQWTLAQNIALPLRLRGVRRRARQPLVQAALEQVQLGGLGGLMPHAATAAQRQRAALARASVFAPKLLLLDEPLAEHLGAEHLALMGSLRRIHEMLGATTILATRNAGDALALCDRIAVLRNGAVEQHGTAEEIFNRPRNDFVASLFGETNQLPGIVQAVEDDVATIRLACGPEVEARCNRDLAPGDACLLLLRPDRIAIAAVPAAEIGDGALDATLIETQFHGDTYRLRLLIGSGAEIVVRRPAGAGLRGLTPGHVAAIAWQPYHAIAFGVAGAA
jgi:putative spermidine/putrescine transport system ATP-binding protein